MIQLEDVHFKIGKNQILEAINHQFERNQIHMILGANGAGKTSLLKIIAGLNQKFMGSVWFEGKSLDTYSPSQLAKKRAVLSQHINFAFPLSVEEIVTMGRYPYFNGKPRKSDLQIIDEIIHFFDLASFRNRQYHTLSGGEQQRVQFARVICQLWDTTEVSKVLLLDEPLTYLDIGNQHSFLKKMQQLVNEHNFTIIGIIHDLSLALRYANQIVMMKNGKIIASGETKATISTELIASTYEIQSEIYEYNGKLKVEVI